MYDLDMITPVESPIADLEERPPRHSSYRKTSAINICEAENPSSSVNVSLESSPQKSKREMAAILVTGGMNPNNLHTIGVGGATLNYDPKEDKWARYGTLPSPRHNHSAVFWDNCLYIIGQCMH
ncbi:hypothetical protein AVEN_268773-1 [Araneus ventricosus]|uniref:Uncharacterized protein n=1 Tax=Araneus ventricosus TaxID=182803 RepID=A0A4Y2K7Z6_ARAVE|nr:hypothetical protein AVEN_268773-1 [Araneus ventricosus]